MEFSLRKLFGFLSFLFVYVGGLMLYHCNGTVMDIIGTVVISLSLVFIFLTLFVNSKEVKGKLPKTTREEEMVEEVLEKLMLYCDEKGLNTTIMQTEHGMVLAKVDDDLGQYEPLVNLSMPSLGTISDENMNEYLDRLKMEVDSALSNVSINTEDK